MYVCVCDCLRQCVRIGSTFLTEKCVAVKKLFSSSVNNAIYWIRKETIAYIL